MHSKFFTQGNLEQRRGFKTISVSHQHLIWACDVNHLRMAAIVDIVCSVNLNCLHVKLNWGHSLPGHVSPPPPFVMTLLKDNLKMKLYIFRSLSWGTGSQPLKSKVQILTVRCSLTHMTMMFLSEFTLLFRERCHWILLSPSQALLHSCQNNHS